MTFLKLPLQLGFLLLLGLLIGHERAKENKVIGIRTTTLILLGSFAFAYMAPLLNIAEAPRIITGIAGAVGFIGSGIIWKGEDHIGNLTTSVLILVLAAIGCLLALDFWIEALMFSIITWVILDVYPKKQMNNQ